MPSPFPGMDPYIECTPELWVEFHGRLIDEIYRAIAKSLPERYTVATGMRCYVVLVEPKGKKEHLALPDVGIHQPGWAASKKSGGAAVAEPEIYAGSVAMNAFVAEQYKERFVEVYLEGEPRTLVAVIEVLSPSNKASGSEGWKVYLRKRQAMLLGQANFLELDLLRGGTKLPMIEAWPDSPYTLLVSLLGDGGRCRVWPAHYNHRLPPIPVPLAYPDKDLVLDLQPLIDDIYAVGRYHNRIDYGKPPTPPLPAADAAARPGQGPTTRP